jgi:two-component system NtrC family sensor kinase
MPADVAPTGTRAGPDRASLARLVATLASARTPEIVADRLVEHLIQAIPGAHARVYILGPGDRCAACPRARECTARDRCLHLLGTGGAFAQTPVHADRVPRLGTAWQAALAVDEPIRVEIAPPELSAPGAVVSPSVVLLAPIRAGDVTLGVVGVRVPVEAPEEAEERVAEAAFLAGAALDSAASRTEEHRRFEQLQLVSDLGRKVNSILNPDLLLRQAVVDIQRTFGYRHVSLLVVDRATKKIQLQAQSSRYDRTEPSDRSIDLDQGIVGRAVRSGRTVRVDDVSREADYVNWWIDTKSEIAVPVRIAGVVEAVLNVESDRVAAFGETDVVVLETAANQLAIAIENARLFGRVRESEEEYRALVESAPIAVLQLDADGRVTYANPAFSDLTGYDRSTALSRFGLARELAAPEDRAAFEAARADAAAGRARRGLEFRAIHADGGVRWVSAELQPLVAEGGARKGVLVLARNITREKELANQLHQSEKLKAMGEMVSGVAHELNNPLSGILGFAQLFLSRPSEQWSRRDMEKIEGNARRCKKIVENLLTFARQSRSERVPGNLNEVIESVIALNEYQFRMDNVEMVRDFDSRVPAIPLDVSRWQQVFINLASNAREAMVEAACSPRRVTFSSRLKGAEIVIQVRDTGPGIPRHLRGRVFDPFFTTKEHGTGLGLGLCYGIVADHGGSIVAEDADPGTGATITIRVPCVSATEAPASPDARQAAKAESKVPVRKALVIDDEQIVRDVVTNVLELHGYDVDTARDSTEAFERIDSGTRYDVVLSDLRMPGPLDGMGIHRRLQQTRPDLAKKVVFMTGDIMEHGLFHDMETLGVQYVKKPFDIRELARIVNDVAAK